MCGIAGIAATGRSDLVPLEIAAARMTAALRHRGPDDEGCETILDASTGRPAVLLAHTRLAILDLSAAGHQPMHDPVTGNWIVLNGEVYNFRELRDVLSAADTSWASNSDTEVVLRAYARWGIDCLPRLRGMFAMALWDAAGRRLLLARDPFGIKPLYYALTPQQLVFASEVRALLESGLVARRLSPAGVASYLAFGSVEAPLTIVRDVESLAPGHVLTAQVQDGKLHTRLQPFAPLLGDPPPIATADALRETLESSVRAHLVSDVPVGAFLSGGIDSSAIVALMSRVAPDPPRTFSVTFAERGFSEAAYARAVAQRYGTQHTEIPLSEDALLALLPEALRAMDQPTIDGVNTYVVSRAVRAAGMRVALSGLGGDELFGGYPSFARARRLRWWRSVPRSIRRALAGVARAAAAGAPRAAKAATLLDCVSPRDVYVASRQLFAPVDLSALADGDSGAALRNLLPDVPADADPFLAMCFYELYHYMGNTLLRDTDTMSMASALEVRVPFVDREVVRAVLAMPSALKVDGQRPKPLLLDALGDLLPDEIWRRPKMGFTLPLEVWMQSRLSSGITAVFKNDDQARALGLRADAIRRLWQSFLRQPRRVGWSRPWALYVLAQWSALHGTTV